jgi:hypothetical protein
MLMLILVERFFRLGTPEEWTQMLNVNVVALNLCTQLAFKSMIEVRFS